MRLLCKFTWICIFLAGLIASCKKSEPAQPKLSAVNKWILDSMHVYYYWADGIRKDQPDDADADLFFTSLLNADDRFSYLEDPARPMVPTSSYAYYGFLYAITGTDLPATQSLAMVTLVVPNGPAHRHGLNRGDVILSVNGIAFNAQNVENIKNSLGQGEALDLQIATLSGNTLGSTRQLTLTAGYFENPPVFVTKVFSGGGKKTGYIYYDVCLLQQKMPE